MHRKSTTPVAELARLLQWVVSLLPRALSLLPRDRALQPRASALRRGPIARLAGLAGVGLAVLGLVVVVSNAVSANAAPAERSAANTAQDRQQAADRADRSAREAPAASASPNNSASPTPGPVVAEPVPVAPPPPAWVSPMPGVGLSSCFGWRWGAAHLGLDFAGPAGATIHAVGAGTVASAGWLYAGYGNSVIIDHGDGTFTHYAHASRVLVQAGEHVDVGQAIALEGSTGNSTGPHLHFEVHQGLWNQVNPADWLRAHGVPAAC